MVPKMRCAPIQGPLRSNEPCSRVVCPMATGYHRPMNTWAATSTRPRSGAMLRAGLIGGLLGGVGIWLYELVVWVHLLHLTDLSGMLDGAAVLVFGSGIRRLGALSMVLGVGIHFVTAMAWGVGFAFLWPSLKARGIEATLAALIYGILAWIIMHNVLLALFSPAPPTYTTYSVLNGFVSHTFTFTVPMALAIKRLLR